MKRHRASFTAASVARSASMGAKYSHPSVLSDTYIEAMLGIQRTAGIVTPFHEYMASTSIFQTILNSLDKSVAPGISAHMALRKRYILDQTQAAIAKGLKSVTNIGAGFDALCWHLAPLYPDVMFYEIDHPLTAHDKENALSQLGKLPSNFQIIPVDLSRIALQSIMPEAIKSHPALFIAEGLLMYLPDQAVRGLFQSIANNCRPTSEIVFTHLPIDENQQPHIGGPRLAALSRWILKRLGEPILWGCSPHQLGDFLQSVGMQLDDHPTFADLSTRYLADDCQHETHEWFATGQVK